MLICSSRASRLFSSLLSILVLTGATVAIAQDASPDPDLYWVKSQEGIWRVEPGEEPVQLIDLPNSSFIDGLDASIDSEQLYWLQHGDNPNHPEFLESIRRAERDGSGQAIVVDYAGNGMNTVQTPEWMAIGSTGG